jgi:DNA primase
MPQVASYQYRSACGSVAFFKRRYEPKRFSYCLANGTATKSDKLPKLLYRLPELIHADPSATVFVVEGEKDADALAALDLVATCNFDGGGSGKWSDSYNHFFRGRNVVILPDNDRTGRDHAEDVARSLTGVAASVKVVDLPGLPPKGDVSDWLANGGTAHQLVELSRTAPKCRQTIELTRPDDEYQGEWALRCNIERVLRTDLTPQEKLLLIVLEAKIARPKPTQRTIAAAVSLSPGRVKKILANLRKHGIVSTSKHGRENVYYMRPQ